MDSGIVKTCNELDLWSFCFLHQHIPSFLVSVVQILKKKAWCIFCSPYPITNSETTYGSEFFSRILYQPEIYKCLCKKQTNCLNNCWKFRIRTFGIGCAIRNIQIINILWRTFLPDLPNPYIFFQCGNSNFCVGQIFCIQPILISLQ